MDVGRQLLPKRTETLEQKHESSLKRKAQRKQMRQKEPVGNTEGIDERMGKKIPKALFGDNTSYPR